MTPIETIVTTCIFCGPKCEFGYGKCHCGCGNNTPIATKKRARWGYSKGLPTRFIHGHNRSRDLSKTWDGSTCICRRENCQIPFGECHCGCGRKVNIASASHTKYGHIKGQPILYIGGHSGHSRGRQRNPTLFLKLEGKEVTFVPLADGLYTVVNRGTEKRFRSLWSRTQGGYITFYDTDKRRHQLLHRRLMGDPEGMVVDHINGNVLDNRLENLRIVTQAQNAINQGLSKNNKSGYKGVNWDKGIKKWTAYITFQRTRYFLGAFDLLEDALEVREEAERKYHGEYARAR